MKNPLEQKNTQISHEIVSEDQKKNNTKRSRKFVQNWENDLMSNHDISHEKLSELLREVNDMWHLEFDDDKDYFRLKNQLEEERKKDLYFTEKERGDSEIQISQTAKGSLELLKEFIEDKLYELSEEQKDIEEKKSQEALAKAYGYPDGYEVFDPEQELNNINKFTEEENREMSPEEKKNIKKDRLEEYKKKLVEQKIGIAKINSELENMIIESRDVNRDRLEKFLAEKAKEYNLSKGQIDKYRLVFWEAQKRNKIIKEFSQKFKGRKDEFFETMFDKKPFGKIDIEAGAVSFSVICEDGKDYAWINSFKYIIKDNSNINNINKDYLPTSSFGGNVISSGTRIAELKDYVTAINAISVKKNVFYEANLRSIIIHEEKHEINNLINTALSKEFPSGLKNKEEMGKNEILAYFKAGHGCEAIGHILLERGSYDYFEEEEPFLQESYDKYAAHPEFYKDLPFLMEHIEKIKKRLKNIKKEKKIYKEHIKNALEILSNLEILGFSRGEIIGLFQTEDLTNWSKVFKLIRNNSDFKEKKAQF